MALIPYQPPGLGEALGRYAAAKASRYIDEGIDLAYDRSKKFIKEKGQAIMRKAKSGWKRFKATMAKAPRKRVIQPRTTTEQRDSRVGYVKRRMPRRMRRRWKSFTRKVQHVMLQMGATQTFSQKFATLKSYAADQQNYWGYMLGGVSATNNDELLKAFRVAYGSALPLADLDDYKLFIKSLCLDIQFNNNSTDNKTSIVEIYHLRCRKSYNTATALDTQFLDTFNEIPAQSGFTRSITDPGYTPFQNSLFCSYWTIAKKEQIQLGPGELSTMQIRIPYNRMMYGKKLETNPAQIAGFTRGLLFIVKGEPENSAGTARLSSGEIVWTTQTTVNYQIPPSTTRTQTATT